MWVADPLKKPTRSGKGVLTMGIDFAELLPEQESYTLEDITKATKGMKLADVSDGAYIPREKFNKRTDADGERITELEAKVKELESSVDGDEALKKQVDSLKAELEAVSTKAGEYEKAAEDAKSQLTRKEREALAREKVSDPKLARLALLDAEALVTDEMDFDTALDKVIAGDDDYQSAGDTPRTSGAPTKGQPEPDEPTLAAFKKGAGLEE